MFALRNGAKVMKKTVKKLFAWMVVCGALCLGFLSCGNSSDSASVFPFGGVTQLPKGNTGSQGGQSGQNEHKYLSIRYGRACELKDGILSYGSGVYDYILNDEIEDKTAGVAKGYWYGLQLVSMPNHSYCWNPIISIEGNASADTVIADKVDVTNYGSFYPLYIAPDETSESIKIVAVSAGDENVKGTLTLDVWNKFNRSDFSADFNFPNKIFLTNDDVVFIKDAISNNSTVDYNLDFSNCRFEFDTIPNGAFSKVGESIHLNLGYYEETQGSADEVLKNAGALVNIKSVILPDNIKEIGWYAFSCCYNMQLNRLPESLEAVSYGAFLYCKSIALNKIPNNVKRIDGRAFERCRGISSIELSSKLESFDCGAFEDCENISEIEIPATVKTVTSSGIYGVIHFDFKVSEQNENFKSENGVLYSKDGKTLYKIPNSKVGNIYYIPNTVKKIVRNALCELKNLNTLYIPSSVTEMESLAIVNCKNLKTVNIDFSEKPSGWEDGWIWNESAKTINYTGTASGAGGSGSSLSGAYTIKNNTSGQLKFINGTLEFIYSGLTRDTYSYQISGSVLTVTWVVSQGTFVGQFDIEQTSSGYKLKQKDDVALSWVGTWTHAASTEEVEIYK